MHSRRVALGVIALVGCGIGSALAGAQGVRPECAEHAILLSPSGVDDTAQLQAALDECASAPGSCSIRLTAGTFRTSQLVGTRLRGALRGAGMHRTVLEALMARPQSSADWGRSPITPDNPWPGILTFVDSDVAVSDLSVVFRGSPLAPEYDLTGWGGGFLISDYFSAVVFVGEESNGRIQRVHAQAGPGTAFGYNLVVAFAFQPSVLKEPQQPPPLGHFFYKSIHGSLKVTDSSCDGVSTCVGTFGAADADVEVAHNTMRNGDFAFFMEPAMEHARVEFSRNVARNMAFGAVFATHESRSSRGPTRLRIANNDIEVPDPIDGLFLADFSASPALDLQVLDNRFETTGTRFGAMYVLQVANATVSRNTIAGASGYGIYLAGSGGDIQGNRLRGAAVGIWLDGSSRTAVSGNQVTASDTWGIALQNGSSHNNVSRNSISGSGQFDLLWDETGEGNRWTRNRCGTSNPPALCEP